MIKRERERERGMDWSWIAGLLKSRLSRYEH
ncbi:hypothetical protein HCH_04638 [Hahella chejuensis KCTC 2396]|uniref:Uncharacterized protein n=1 Tax=Hahella chejuensis (strain KCTC 2396) TaxID=349521 RepID=Q2SDD7_HAHCH|nr:hypothetical protein HCH_04638 [Hahella chejuensis KCTC 2396]